MIFAHSLVFSYPFLAKKKVIPSLLATYRGSMNMNNFFKK